MGGIHPEADLIKAWNWSSHALSTYDTWVLTDQRRNKFVAEPITSRSKVDTAMDVQHLADGEIF